jgi:hypothetical protein
MRTDTETLVAALKILSRDIESEDGVANAAIYEAAQRLEDLERDRDFLIHELMMIERIANNKDLYVSNLPDIWDSISSIAVIAFSTLDIIDRP